MSLLLGVWGAVGLGWRGSTEEASSLRNQVGMRKERWRADVGQGGERGGCLTLKGDS